MQPVSFEAKMFGCAHLHILLKLRCCYSIAFYVLGHHMVEVVPHFKVFFNLGLCHIPVVLKSHHKSGLELYILHMVTRSNKKDGSSSNKPVEVLTLSKLRGQTSFQRSSRYTVCIAKNTVESR